MPSLLNALSQGLALADQRGNFLRDVALRREQVVGSFRRDQADNFFNQRVNAGANPLQAQFELSRQGFGINQSNQSLLNALQGTFASAPLAAAAAFGGNQAPGQQLLQNFTGQPSTNPLGISALFGLGGNLQGANNQQLQSNIFPSLFPNQPNPNRLPAPSTQRQTTTNVVRPVRTQTGSQFAQTLRGPGSNR